MTAARLGAVGPAPRPPASEARLHGRRHSRARDRAAIAHHYDLSNEFYALLLDETMAYSSAYFTSPDQSLVDAQRAKLDLICRKLDLSPGHRLLDVGCGWGSLILHAAEHFGVSAVGVTLSEQQRDHVAKQIAERGLADRVTVRLQDYRELAGTGETFDAVSSIEMGEHVGEEQYPDVRRRSCSARWRRPAACCCSRCHGRTAPRPAAVPSSSRTSRPTCTCGRCRAPSPISSAQGFEIRDVEAMREHYVRTVDAWIDTFEDRYADFVALLGEEGARVWRLYLVGGAASFAEGRMGVDQILAVRPTPDGRSGLPADRPWAVLADPT